MKRLVITIGSVACIVVGAGVLVSESRFSRLSYWKSAAGLASFSNERIWEAIASRAQIYLHKTTGGVPELSWAELWELTKPANGFSWKKGRSLEGNFAFSFAASESDRNAGRCIFRHRCTGCHGAEASGGLHGPSLRRSRFRHGDSDLSIYKVLRDGVPGTAMPSAGLPARQLRQLVAYIRSLQIQSPKVVTAGAPNLAIQVSSERLQAAGSDPGEWLTYSGSYDGWRYSSLAEITPANAAQLKIRWIKQFEMSDPYVEGTPLVAGGAIFLAAPAAHVWALDAKTGAPIWEYVRPIAEDLPVCCGRNNRGLAVSGSTVFFGSLDGALVALNANDGTVIWETLVASPSEGYSLTGAPLVVDHSVVIGVAGGEFGIRGFLAAYDVATGQQQWKFETVPRPGEAGQETWGGGDGRQMRGGATWATGSYDPAAGLIYWGTGNPAPPYSGDARPGDNLFTASVIALHASSGKLAWYFQFTPHDEHDWDSAQTPVLAELPVGGVVRKVICWPNRNGFYYVLDRITGEFLAGVPFVELDWAEGLTPSGRPIFQDGSEEAAGGQLTKPGVGGGTNWQNPAFDPAREAIFVPATEVAAVFTKGAGDGGAVPGQAGIVHGSGAIDTSDPPPRLVRALDAASGRRKWEYHSSPSATDYSGLLATAGGLVFGAAGGFLFALDADSGREVWRVSLGGKTMAAPISFAIGGRQVIAIAAGHALFVFGL